MPDNQRNLVMPSFPQNLALIKRSANATDIIARKGPATNPGEAMSTEVFGANVGMEVGPVVGTGVGTDDGTDDGT